MLQVVCGLAFILYFFSISIAIGLVAFERYLWKDGKDRLATFFIGFGLGSYAISVYNAMFLVVFSHLPSLYFSILHFLIFLFSVGIIIKTAPRFIKYVRQFASNSQYSSTVTNRALLCSMVLSLAVIFSFCLHYALQPLDNRDSLVYGTEVKIIAGERSYEARLSVDTPGLRNAYRGNDHPISFISYLATAVFFQTSLQEDFPLRVAFQLPNVALFICLCGFALRYGVLAGALSSALFFTGIYFGTLMQISGRDSYYIIPTLLLIQVTDIFQGNKITAFKIIIFLCWLFMWSSHSGSLLFGALVALVQLILAKSNIDRVCLLGIISASFLIGGNHYIVAYHETGSLLGNERTSTINYKDTCPINNIATEITTKASVASQSFLKYLNTIKHTIYVQVLNDKLPSVAIVVIAIAVPFVMIAFGKAVPASVFAASGFVAILWLLSIGVADFISPVISFRLMQNMRYRTIFVPIAAYAVGVGCLAFLKHRLLHKRAVQVVVLTTTLLLPLSSLLTWPINHFPPMLFRKDIINFFANGGSWWPYFAVFQNIPPNSTDAILTMEDYFAWYYTDYNVISLLQDKRMLPLADAENIHEARDFILRNNIKYFVFFNNFIKNNKCSSLIQFVCSYANEVYAGEYYTIFYYSDTVDQLN